MDVAFGDLDQALEAVGAPQRVRMLEHRERRLRVEAAAMHEVAIADREHRELAAIVRRADAIGERARLVLGEVEDQQRVARGELVAARGGAIQARSE